MVAHCFWCILSVEPIETQSCFLKPGCSKSQTVFWHWSLNMASLTSSSRRASSSYRSSARYSTSSSYCTEGSLGGSSDSLDTILEPFLDYADHSSLFGEEGPGGPNCLAPFRRHSRPFYGHDGKELLCQYTLIYATSAFFWVSSHRAFLF